jgi:uncharacterized membrane protein YkoI
MKSLKKIIVVAALALVVATGARAAAEESQEKLLREAKVDRSHAEVIALGRARGGKVKSAEIEREHGHLVWSFDITLPNTSDIMEVQVDAKTGKVVAVEKENPSQQAKEAKEDQAKKH